MVRIRLRLFLLALATASIFVATPASYAYAATATAQGAHTLKTIFEDVIKQQKDISSLNHDSQVIFEGDVTVEPVGDYYAITLPDTKIRYQSGDTLDIGIISINASEHDIAGQWKMSIALPTPIIMYTPRRNQIMRINIGAQQSGGIWDESMRHFIKLNSTYKNVTIESARPYTYSATIPTVEVHLDLTKNADNTWSGPLHISGKDVQFNLSDTGQKGNINNINARFDLDQYNPAALQQYQQQVGTLAQGNNPAALQGSLIELIMTASKGFKAQISADGLNTSAPTKAATNTTGAPTLSFDKAFLAFDLSDFGASNDNGNVKMNSRLAFSNLRQNTAQNDAQSLTPTDANIDIRMENLPLRQLLALDANSNIALTTRIATVMSQAGSVINMNDNHITGKDYKVDMNGLIQMHGRDISSATADISTAITGLDALMQKTKAQAADASNPDHPTMQAASLYLGMLSLFAQPEQRNGQTVHTFKLVVTPTGQILINGMDINATMGLIPQSGVTAKQ
jgi:hypothetical protein